MTTRGGGEGEGVDLPRRGKASSCPQAPVLSWGQEDAFYRLFFFMKWQHLPTLSYIVGAAIIRTNDISFGVSIQPLASPGWSQSLPAGHIVHPLLSHKPGQGKSSLSFGTSVELELLLQM